MIHSEKPTLGKKLALSLGLIFTSAVYAFFGEATTQANALTTKPTPAPLPATPSITIETPPPTSVQPTTPYTNSVIRDLFASDDTEGDDSNSSDDNRTASVSPTPAPVVTPAPTKTPTPTSTSAPAPAPKKGLYTDGSYTGSVADAYYGKVQVKAIISGGKITDVQFLQHPQSHSNSVYINSRAMPLLTQEAISAQSASVDGVSGATFTSDAFRQSLSAALTQAKA